MNNNGFSFFEISDDTGRTLDTASIRVDHEVLMSIKSISDWDSLGAFEGLFAVWYQEQIAQGMEHSPIFLIVPKLLEPYDQEAICEEIMEMLSAEIFEDPNI